MLAVTNEAVYQEVLKNAVECVGVENVVEVFKPVNSVGTKCGKYSNGPLCNSPLVESVGAFCCFAVGAKVVPNHPTEYLSMHEFIYLDTHNEHVVLPYDERKNEKWYFPGVKPKGKVDIKKITIGNDVWIGSDVIITNNANIGNGAIVGAGAVFTKDVPDYAVVAGVPARIIRYRYSPEQIEALNEIRWWNWTDEQIRERYDDFFIDIDLFIEKYR